MSRPSRREFAKLLAATGAGIATGAAAPMLAPIAIAQTDPRIVIVGGGAGGASVAHYLRMGGPDLDITLIEPNRIYSSSFFSNLYLGGIIRSETLNHSYSGLRRLYIKVVHDLATDVNAARKTVTTSGGRIYHYDRLVLSPGIDIKYDAIEGYSRAAAHLMPHAYTTDAAQKRLLKRQLKQMRPGGTVAMVMPSPPYRCPPAPYERACMIAHYLKTRKPRSKLVILDPKRSFAQQPLFEEAFAKYYKNIIDMHLSDEIDDFSVAMLDPRRREILTRAGKGIRADVANVIPPQRAGVIAARAGCTDGDWCPVHPESFLSRLVPDIHVLGDAAIAADMPKAASAAHSQAKMVAANILAALTNAGPVEPAYASSCWSLLAPDDAIRMSARYTPQDGRLEATEVHASKTGERPDVRRQSYQESLAWYANITSDIFAKTAMPPAERTPAPAEKKAG